ncbi:hypothetical protein VaNZ11_008965, partial [Volvox africanus]
ASPGATSSLYELPPSIHHNLQTPPLPLSPESSSANDHGGGAQWSWSRATCNGQGMLSTTRMERYGDGRRRNSSRNKRSGGGRSDITMSKERGTARGGIVEPV